MTRFCALILLAFPSGATEIATGGMLGDDYDKRSFYVRYGQGSWRKTYTGPEYRPEAAGRLMNLRIGQAVVHGEWLTEQPCDPERNTDRVIAALDTYKQHGTLAISVSLHGANPAYERTPNIKPIRPYKLGPDKGMLMSAFRHDGSLKPRWLARTLRLVRELDRRGMVLHLLYFYQHQDEVLRDAEALKRGATNVTDWLIDNDVRNAPIEVANEVNTNTYNHDRFLRNNLVEMVQLIRGRFAAKNARFRLPISSSTTGGAMEQIPPAIFDHADLVLLHGNNRTPEDKGRRTAELMAGAKTPGPVVFGEDNYGRDTDDATLKLEPASLESIWSAGGSWGYMPWVQAQIFPFRMYDPAGIDNRDARYFRAVRERIRSLVYQDKRGSLVRTLPAAESRPERGAALPRRPERAARPGEGARTWESE